MKKGHYDTIVLGAGINGLSTAYHLLRRGVTRLAVVDQFAIGHSRGSSHGKSRITRSSYSTAKYVELIQAAHEQEWTRLARDAGQSFLHPTPGCFFGPGIQPYIDSLRSVPALADAFRVLTPDVARRVFPCFTFPDSAQVIHDTTCATVAAEATLRWLAGHVAARADLLAERPVQRIVPTSASIELPTPQGTLTCERLVVTAGSWLGRLLPELEPRLQVAHQDVGYFALPGGEAVPVWVYVPEQGDSFYGLPEFGREGVKVARHRTGPEGDDPDRSIPEGMADEVRADLESFVRRQFSQPASVVGYEACLYTNTRSEDFLLDHHPEDERIVIGSACSGHGFKFGPLTGRILTELLLDGRTSLEAFERHRDAFRLSAHAPWREPHLPGARSNGGHPTRYG